MRTALVTFLYVSLFVSSAASDDAPWFCHGYECPQFTTLKSTPAYDVREYPAAPWMGMQQEGSSLTDAQSSAFRHLFRYITGANEDEATIDMTCPVITRVQPQDASSATFDTLFYMPDKRPAPTDADLHSWDSPRVVVAVTSFGGWMSDNKAASHAKDLEAALRRDGMTIVNATAGYITAGYDAPYRLLWRHNEVWIPIKF